MDRIGKPGSRGTKVVGSLVLVGASFLASAALTAVLTGCSRGEATVFDRDAGVREVWVVQKKGALDRSAFRTVPGRIRFTLENQMESATRVSVVRTRDRETVADFPVGIRQVNWQEVDLPAGNYEIVAVRLSDGGASVARVEVGA